VHFSDRYDIKTSEPQRAENSDVGGITVQVRVEIKRVHGITEESIEKAE